MMRERERVCVCVCVLGVGVINFTLIKFLYTAKVPCADKA